MLLWFHLFNLASNFLIIGSHTTFLLGLTPIGIPRYKQVNHMFNQIIPDLELANTYMIEHKDQTCSKGHSPVEDSNGTWKWKHRSKHEILLSLPSSTHTAVSRQRKHHLQREFEARAWSLSSSWHGPSSQEGIVGKYESLGCGGC